MTRRTIALPREVGSALTRIAHGSLGAAYAVALINLEPNCGVTVA